MFPIHLDLGYKTIYFFEGFYIVGAVLIGISLARSRLKKYSTEKYDFSVLLLYVLICSFLGMHFSHYFFWDYKLLIDNPLVIFKVWESGTSIIGGLMGGIFGAWLFTKKAKINFWKLFGILSPAILIGQALGRIGCFLNGDAHGIFTNLPWGMEFPKYGTTIPSFEKLTSVLSIPWQWSFNHGLINTSSNVSASLHPTQLYDGIGVLILLAFVLFMLRSEVADNSKFKAVFFIHTGGYSVLRFGIEFIRADSAEIVFAGLNLLQIFLFAWFVFSAFMIIWNFKVIQTNNKMKEEGD